MEFFQTEDNRFFPLSSLSFIVKEDKQQFQNQGNREILVERVFDNFLIEKIPVPTSYATCVAFLQAEIALRLIKLP